MVAEAPFVVLKDSVAVHGLTVKPEEERAAVAPPGKDWPRRSIQISRKKAHGCGDHGHKLLEGLTLHLHSSFATDLLDSFLSIGLSDVARRSIEAELGVTPGAGPGVVRAKSTAEIVAEQLLILRVTFTIHSYSERAYYLVYDSTDASLNMIPSLPLGLTHSFTEAPVVRFTGVARDPELILLARRKWLQPNDNYRVCVCTPETRANAGPDSTGLWQVRKRTRFFPKLPYPLSVDEVFSFQGKLFWADLSQGLVYCSHHQLPAAGESPVEFGFISLPRGYLVDAETAPEPIKMVRTMSCVGGCIQFVCIERHSFSPGGHTVNVWDLDLDRRQWKDHEGFPCLWKEFWRQDAGARDVEAQYPVLFPGGALCLLLSNTPEQPGGSMCGFDMGSKSLLWSGTVHDYDKYSVILPRNFVTRYHPPSKETRKRNLPSSKTELSRKARRHDQSRAVQKWRD